MPLYGQPSPPTGRQSIPVHSEKDLIMPLYGHWTAFMPVYISFSPHLSIYLSVLSIFLSLPVSMCLSIHGMYIRIKMGYMYVCVYNIHIDTIKGICTYVYTYVHMDRDKGIESQGRQS